MSSVWITGPQPEPGEKGLRDTMLTCHLDSFTASSKELENELEDELQHTEAREQDLKGRLAVAEGERDDWKVRPKD